MRSQTLTEAWSTSSHLLADRMLVQDWPGDFPWYEIAPLSLVNERHLLPVLMPLKRLNREQEYQLRELLAMPDMRGVPPAMLLHTDLSTQSLAAQLADHIMLTLADESMVILRFADPQVFIHLLWILPLPHLAALYQCVNRWALPFQGAWHELQFNQRTKPAWISLPDGPSLALRQVGAMHKVLSRLPVPEDMAMLWRTSEQIGLLLECARVQFLLIRQTDRVACARHGMLLGKDFFRHPRIAESLHAAREAPGRYEQLTAAFSQHDWDTIIFELKQTESNRSSA
jgi:hypothetical protein